MQKILIVALCTLIVILNVDGKKSFNLFTSRSVSGRGSSKRTNYSPPKPTSHSYPQQSVPKPTLFGWQEKPSQNAQRNTQTKPKQTQTHSYPSSQTGMSGNNQPKQAPPPYHDSVQKSSASQNLNGQHATNNQQGHSYPASTGLSGNPAGGYPQAPNGLSGSSGGGYPQNTGSGLSRQQGSGYPQGTGVSGAGAAPPPYPGGAYPTNNNHGNNFQHPPPPPPYSHVGNHGGYGGQSPNYGGQAPNYGGHGSGYGGYGAGGPGYGGYGGHGSYSPAGPQMPGYFGNYGNNGKWGNGGTSRGTSALAGVGIAGAGIGTVLTGLALYNLARSTGQHHHTVIYDNRGQPVAVAQANNTEADSILADLVNCTLSISNGNNTEVLAIPCSIATSFTPDADVKDFGTNGTEDNTKCTISILTKQGKEFMTTIPCATLLNTAAENNVTEPPLLPEGNVTDIDNVNGTVMVPPAAPQAYNQPPDVVQDPANKPIADLNCTPQPGEVRDPINPCYAITHNITVAPLPVTEKNENK